MTAPTPRSATALVRALLEEFHAQRRAGGHGGGSRPGVDYVAVLDAAVVTNLLNELAALERIVGDDAFRDGAAYLTALADAADMPGRRARLSDLAATLRGIGAELARVREQRDRALDLADRLVTDDEQGHADVDIAEAREQLDRLRRAAS